MKKVMFSMMFGLLVLMLAGAASAATLTAKVVNIADSQYLTGTVQLSIEVNQSALVSRGTGVENSSNNVTKIEWLYTFDGGSETSIGSNTSNLNNVSAGNTSVAVWNLTWPTTALQDVKTNYKVRAKVYNGSGGTNLLATTAYISSMTLDNTVPASAYGSSTTADAAKVATKTFTVQSATDANASTCTLTWGSTSFTLSLDSNEQCSKTWSPSAGTYTYYLTLGDGTNTTTLASRTVEMRPGVSGKGDTGTGVTTPDVQPPSKGLSPLALAVIAGSIIGGMALLGVGIWLYGKKK